MVMNQKGKVVYPIGKFIHFDAHVHLNLCTPSISRVGSFFIVIIQYRQNLERILFVI